MSTDTQLALSYAALILADEGVKPTPDKLQTLLKAAGIEDIENIWSTIFAKAVKDEDMKDILTTVSISSVNGVAGRANNKEVEGVVEDGVVSQDRNGEQDEDSDAESDLVLDLFEGF